MAETEIVQIERMSYGPDAIAHLASGKVVFVAGGVPGDHVRIRVTEDKPKLAKAHIEDVVDPSPLRVGPQAGVEPALCPWASLSYEAQLEEKASAVKSALLRVGGISAERLERLLKPPIPSKKQWGYRNKLEMEAFADGQGRLTLGFHESASATTAALHRCPLGNRLIEKAPKALTGALRYLSSSTELNIYRVGIRGSIATGEVEVALWTPPSSFPRSFAAKLLRDAVHATSIVRVIAEPGSARAVKRVEVLDGRGHWDETLAGSYGYRVSAPSFFQVNSAQAAHLIDVVHREMLEQARSDAPPFIADLYCGVGTFAIPLAREAEVAAIELEGSAARDLRANCEENDVEVDVICDDVGRALPTLGRLDGVVVDPPRAGLAKEVIGQIVEAAPSKIVYVSCDPQTLSRDIARFEARGYGLASATPVDMFPQTYHIETVAVLEKL